MDLSNYSYTELLELQKKVQAEISGREREEKNKARAQILELAKMHGLSVQDVLVVGKPAARKPVEPKYQNPTNPSQQWTGRGRKPVWVEELLAQGKSLTDLTI
ncbi:H-NS family nucleoid-associated regulatory protein [Pseudogulbenkiania sp. MAI-1]|uniref:H-NS histone family protein n=1 Tax=Pseudogulbenkiania sp. MAI-1 TaxID=990370 RepID=UPI00045E9D19|nr:H-NS histone family protein [Pseudogulbenkiania sp. MAI-1]